MRPFFYGLLNPEEGALFLGAEAGANLERAETSARQALEIAGVDVAAASANIDPPFPEVRKAEARSDCYSAAPRTPGERCMGKRARHATAWKESLGRYSIGKWRSIRHQQTRAYYLRQRLFSAAIGRRRGGAERHVTRRQAQASPDGAARSIPHRRGALSPWRLGQCRSSILQKEFSPSADPFVGPLLPRCLSSEFSALGAGKGSVDRLHRPAAATLSGPHLFFRQYRQ